MILLLQVAGVIAAAAVASSLWGGSGSVSGTRRGIVVLTVAFAYIAFASHVWSVGRLFADQHKAWAPITADQSLLAGSPGVQGAFAEWIRGRLRPRDHFFITSNPPGDPAVLQWFTYRLLPNFAARDAAHADVLVFYATTPKQSHMRRLVSGPVQQYQPLFSIARRNHAS